MTASSLYNMVDSIFIGLGVGPMAISGLALTFPLMNLAAAFGSLVGVGAATLISMRLGQKDYASAQYILGNVVVLNFIIGLGFGLVTLLFLDPILYFFGASEATDRLRPRLHVDHPDGQRRNAHVSGTELRPAFGGTPAQVDVRHDQHRSHQHDPRPAVHLRLRLGHPRRSDRHGAGAGDLARLAVPAALRFERTAAFPPGESTGRASGSSRDSGHRHVALSDERDGLLHRHPHQQRGSKSTAAT